MILSLLVRLLILPAYASFWPASDFGPLERAHVAYLSGDWPAMVTSATEALEARPTILVRGNVSSLYESAFAETRGALPLGMPLPGVPFLKLGIARFETRVPAEAKAAEEHAITVIGDIVRPGRVRQVRVTRLPGEVLIDREAGVGGWDEITDPGQHWFIAHRSFGRTPPAAGVYRLELRMDDGGTFRATVPVEGGSTGVFPRFLAPTDVTPALAGKRPVFRWEDYRSPEYRPYEERRLLLAVQRPADAVGRSLWYAVLPPRTSIGYGELPSGAHGAPPESRDLAPGDYFVHLSYLEGRRFGPLVVSRETGATAPFSVGR